VQVLHIRSLELEQLRNHSLELVLRNRSLELGLGSKLELELGSRLALEHSS
jgi:hypothetical protein